MTDDPRYRGGPRRAAADAGISLPLPVDAWASYDDVLDAAVLSYWQSRICYGPRCGTPSGYVDHVLNGGRICDACQSAERVAVFIRRAGEAA